MRWITVPVDDEGRILSYRDIRHAYYEDAAVELTEEGRPHMLLTEQAFLALGGVPEGHPLQTPEFRTEWQRYLYRCQGRPEDYAPEDPETLPYVTVEDAHRLKMLECGIGLGMTVDPTDRDVPEFRHIRYIGTWGDGDYDIHLDRGYRMLVGKSVLVNVLVNATPLTRLLHALWLGEMRRRYDLEYPDDGE